MPENTQIDCKFEFRQIVLKDDLKWRLKIAAETSMDKTYRDYNFVFVYNDENELAAIKNFEQKIFDVENDINQRLFGRAKKDEIRELQKEIENSEAEIEAGKKKYTQIEFKGVIEEFKVNSGKIVIVIAISDEAVEEISAKKGDLRYYKVLMNHA